MSYRRHTAIGHGAQGERFFKGLQDTAGIGFTRKVLAISAPSYFHLFGALGENSPYACLRSHCGSRMGFLPSRASTKLHPIRRLAIR